MTHEEFDNHVREIERRFGGRPVALRLRLAGLAAAGYAGLLAGFGVVVVLTAFFFVPAWYLPLGEGWPLLALGSVALLAGAVAMWRALWVRLSPPVGCTVTPHEAPALHAMLDELRGQTGSSAFHRVVVTGACNAAVHEVPRLGLLGWPRHYLQLGLPLLESLSTEEVRAVVAHEYAHLSARDGRFGAWIYRLRRSWEQVFARLREPRVRGRVSLRPLLAKFIEWFWPRFNAHAFVLSRANEYAADTVAARCAGAGNLAGALLRLEVHGRLLEEKFWRDLWLRANTSAEQPREVFRELRETLRAAAPAEAGTWLAQAFRWTASTVDTHPCLADRLRAVSQLPPSVERGEAPPWPKAPVRSAAEMLLGPSLEKVRGEVENRWRSDSAEAWRARHARAGALHDRLGRLEGVTAEAESTDLWEKANLLLALEGDAAAAPFLRELVALRPGHAQARVILGRFLLSQNDPAGVEHLERAMEADEETVPAACEWLRLYYQRQGQEDLVRQIRARLDRHEAAVAISMTERSNVTARDTFLPHTLTPAELEALLAVLAADPQIASADLAQKQMRYFSRQRLFILCLRVRRAWYQLPSRAKEQAAVAGLLPKIKLPGRKLVIAPYGVFGAVAARLAKMPECRIYVRAEG